MTAIDIERVSKNGHNLVVSQRYKTDSPKPDKASKFQGRVLLTPTFIYKTTVQFFRSDSWTDFLKRINSHESQQTIESAVLRPIN